jgi:hypothetical protein
MPMHYHTLLKLFLFTDNVMQDQDEVSKEKPIVSDSDENVLLSNDNDAVNISQSQVDEAHTPNEGKYMQYIKCVSLTYIYIYIYIF